MSEQRHWQRKLGRLRLGVEPLSEQLARYRRVTWVLTAIPLAISLMFLALFSAFRRPDIGLVIAGIFGVPIVVIAWFDYAMLERRAAQYAREQAEFERRQAAEGRSEAGRRTQ
jgi:hypothetical protein